MNVNTEILVQSEKWQNTLPDFEAVVRNVCKTVFTTAELDTSFPNDVEVSVVLMDDEAIAALNAGYRGKDKPTNVLSFPTFDLEPGKPFPAQAIPCECILGDVVLSIDTIEKEATEQKKSMAAHVSHMLVHGVLHLLGYNHIIDTDADIMEAMEIKILAQLGIGNPYEMGI